MAEAVHKNEEALNLAKKNLAKIKIKLQKNLTRLKFREDKKINMLNEIARAQELAVSVAEANLKEYIRVTYFLDDAVLKELQYAVDSKALALLLTRADLSIFLGVHARNERIRDFEAIMRFDHIHAMSQEQGKLFVNRVDFVKY